MTNNAIQDDHKPAQSGNQTPPRVEQSRQTEGQMQQRRVQKIIAEINHEDCPKCGSENTQENSDLFGYINHECHDCNNKWNAQEKLARKRDDLQLVWLFQKDGDQREKLGFKVLKKDEPVDKALEGLEKPDIAIVDNEVEE